jgi:hypothetical protein
VRVELGNRVHLWYCYHMNTTASIETKYNALDRACGFTVTTPDGDVVPFQSIAHAKYFISQGCPK